MAVASSMIGCEKSGSNRRKQFEELKSRIAKINVMIHFTK